MDSLLSDLLRIETRQAHHALDHHPALSSLISVRVPVFNLPSAPAEIFESTHSELG